MPINVIFLAKIAINNHFHIVSNKIQSYHNFFLDIFNILLYFMPLSNVLSPLQEDICYVI